MAAAARATTFGTGAAYVTVCEKAGVRPAGDLDLRALRTVIPTGSPLPPSGWHWLHDHLDDAVRIDPIAGGTDVCTAFVGGSPLLPVRVGEIPCRWLGVHADVLDPAGRTIRDAVGEFVVRKPMPSMPVRLWNDNDGSRYEDTYFSVYPGIWRQGDWASLSADGSLVLLGRSDSTLNRGGVRIGSAEIYAVVERRAEIADSLVVGVELPDGDYYMPLFVVPAESDGSQRARKPSCCGRSGASYRPGTFPMRSSSPPACHAPSPARSSRWRSSGSSGALRSTPSRLPERSTSPTLCIGSSSSGAAEWPSACRLRTGPSSSRWTGCDCGLCGTARAVRCC